jgi:hypothetical protein
LRGSPWILALDRESNGVDELPGSNLEVAMAPSVRSDAGREAAARRRWGGSLLVAVLAALLFGCGEVTSGTSAVTTGEAPGNQREAAEPLETHALATGAVEDPLLALGPDGIVYAVWTAREPVEEPADAAVGHAGHHQHGDGGPATTATILLAVSHDVGRSFSEPVRVDGPDPVEGFAADPRSDRPTQVVVTHDGALHVVWVATRPIEGEPRPANDLRVATSRDGGRSFEAPRQVVTDEEAAAWRPGFHRATVAPDGAFHLAFLATPEEEDTVGRSVRVVTSRDHGASFEPGEAFTTSTCQCCPVSMAAREDGRLALAWRHIFVREDDAQVRDPAVVFSHDGGGSWTEIEPIHEDGWVMDGCPHSGPALRTGPDGSLHVAWYTGREGDPGVRYVRERDDGGFGEPITLASDGFFPVTQPSVDVAADGTAWVAWDDQREDDGTVWLAEVTPGGDVQRADAPLADGRNPRVLAVGEDVLVAWTAPDGLDVAVVRTGWEQP